MRTNTAVYRYLLEEGYLSNGPDAIVEGKREYRRLYQKRHKEKYRKRVSEHMITCKPGEERQLKAAVKAHRMKVSEYIRMAALAYSGKVYLVPNLNVIYNIQQLLILTRTDIQRIGKVRRGFFQRDKSEHIEELLIGLSKEIHNALFHPRDMEHLVLSALAERPEFASHLKRLIDSHDSKVEGT